MADHPEKTEPQPVEPVEDFDKLMRVEYDAWLDFMHHFYRATGSTEAEVNESGGKYDETFIKLRIWGERLAQLRRPQAEILGLDVRGFPNRRAT
jgi:hypothetical protein